MKARLAFAAKGVPFQHCEVDLGKKTPWHLEINNGLAPFLERPDGSIVIESSIIMHYVEEKYRDQGFKLWPHGDADESVRYKLAMMVYAEQGGHHWSIYSSKGEDYSKLPDLVKSMQKIENWLEKNTETPFFMNTAEPTYVDIDALPGMLKYRTHQGSGL